MIKYYGLYPEIMSEKISDIRGVNFYVMVL